MPLWYAKKVQQFREKISKRKQYAHLFMTGDRVDYPGHGRGEIIGVQTLPDYGTDCYVIYFKARNMKVLVPIDKMTRVGATFIRGPSKE